MATGSREPADVAGAASGSEQGVEANVHVFPGEANLMVNSHADVRKYFLGSYMSGGRVARYYDLGWRFRQI